MNSAYKQFTLAILPFDIGSFSGSHNPFDFNFKFEKDQGSLKEFYFNLDMVSDLNAKIKMDKKKYHSHIHFLISNGGESDERSFLKVYKIKPELLYQNENLRLNDQWNVSFCNNTQVVINELAQIGYFIFGFQFIGDPDSTILDFSKLEFFRFYNNDKSFKKYAMLRTHNEGDLISETNKLTLEDVILNSFKGICPYIKMRYERPSLLHLSNKFENISQDELNNILYNSLRIPSSSQINKVILNQDYLFTSGAGVTMSVLNEGASIIDPAANVNELISKYFPAFIIALNQREVMIKINQFSAQLTLRQLNERDNLTVSYLHQLKFKIEVFKFKQLIYSISFFDEIVEFYKRLQITMNIDILLEDNKECIKEIVMFLEMSQKKHDEEVKQRESIQQNRRDLWINATLTGIGCLGLFSFFKDLIPFTLDNSLSVYLGNFSIFYKLFSSISPLILFVGLLRLMRNKVISD
jgi:hypothetical protein